MIADLFIVRKCPKYGKGEKGLFATQFIPKGTVVHFLCKRCGTWSFKELTRLSKPRILQILIHEYPTKYCDRRLGYINHSCNPKIMETEKGFDIVVRDIAKGEEATEDYRIFNEEKHFDGGCKCGEKNCMGKATFRSPAPKKLQKFWDRKINAALKLIPYVKQPLKSRLLKEHPELSYLFKKS
jgi:hypothetical protein